MILQFKAIRTPTGKYNLGCLKPAQGDVVEIREVPAKELMRLHELILTKTYLESFAMIWGTSTGTLLFKPGGK